MVLHGMGCVDPGVDDDIFVRSFDIPGKIRDINFFPHVQAVSHHALVE
jgi:hypothetical protein